MKLFPISMKTMRFKLSSQACGGSLTAMTALTAVLASAAMLLGGCASPGETRPTHQLADARNHAADPDELWRVVDVVEHEYVGSIAGQNRVVRRAHVERIVYRAVVIGGAHALRPRVRKAAGQIFAEAAVGRRLQRVIVRIGAKAVSRRPIEATEWTIEVRLIAGGSVELRS